VIRGSVVDNFAGGGGASLEGDARAVLATFPAERGAA